MRIEILIPTFNRAALLRDCLDSVLRSTSCADWRVTVIDNNSRDNTREVVESFASDRVAYSFEGKKGKSAALNTGIAASEAEIIGMIDDDEQIHPDWIDIAVKWMQEPQIDFIGGPYLGLWRSEKPPWVPHGFEGVVSADDPERIPQTPVRYPDDRVFLRGGNLCVRRAVFDRVGLYRTDVGRGPNDLGSCEDHDMYARLLAGGLVGYYVPDLIIYHLVPPERLTRSYYRRWAWAQAKSLAVLNRAHPQRAAYVGRVPRYMIGDAIRKLPALASRNPARRFGAELEWWRLGGFFLGAYRS